MVEKKKKRGLEEIMPEVSENAAESLLKPTTSQSDQSPSKEISTTSHEQKEKEDTTGPAKPEELKSEITDEEPRREPVIERAETTKEPSESKPEETNEEPEHASSDIQWDAITLNTKKERDAYTKQIGFKVTEEQYEIYMLVKKYYGVETILNEWRGYLDKLIREKGEILKKMDASVRKKLP
ncbi:MAG: hypothetical protein QXP04_05115 [Candidatus Nanoarchaeia archaeon]|nr:hypothetical protein [Candidatus Jingweiarchaeum tengchongense]